MAYTVNEILDMPFENQFRVMLYGLENAKEPGISEHISLLGYVPQKVEQGIALVNTAWDLHTRQITEYGEQFSATESFTVSKEKAEKRVSITWKIAKMAVQDRGIRKTLGIHRDRKYSNNGWMSQLDLFYRNITPEVIALMAEYGYTPEKIAEEWDMVKAVIQAHKKREDEAGEAQRATVERDEAVDELHAWMRKFYKISKMALQDQPQMIEKLGLIDRR